MSDERFVKSIARLAILSATWFGLASYAIAQRELVLHSFGYGKDGAQPYASVAFDASGNLYGTTLNGGTGSNCGQLNCGTVFQLKPAGNGKWTERVLHEFTNNGHDGYGPLINLFIDSGGNLYGGTLVGGYDLRGLVFELTPRSDGSYSQNVLHNFNLSPTEGWSSSSLIMDSTGNLSGTGYEGGTHGVGTLFELTHQSSGDWTERILYAFDNNGIDGNYPSTAGLVADAAGNLYGTTLYGGSGCVGGLGCGTVFELSPKAGGGWTEKILHDFSNISDGTEPYSGVILDASGNLYGTTLGGGATGAGTVFELIRGANGAWREKILYSFAYYSHRDGINPYGGLVFDTAGNLYGTTDGGGAYGYGTVFELSPQADGTWTEKIAHDFDLNGIDGINPLAGLIIDAAGNLYGTTSFGGAYGDGTVFEITP
jgi:uncharacterized repeat protein (TIGR03803 family)